MRRENGGGPIMTQSFLNFDQDWDGHHDGEDWTSGNATVRAVGTGRVVFERAVAPRAAGGIVVVEHTGDFEVRAPSINDKRPAGAPYNGEDFEATIAADSLSLDRFYSVYLHVDPAVDIREGLCVDAEDDIGTLSDDDAAYDHASHLHFAIRTTKPGHGTHDIPIGRASTTSHRTTRATRQTARSSRPSPPACSTPRTSSMPTKATDPVV